MKNYPSHDEITRIRRETKLNMAIEAYRFFFPTISMYSCFYTLDQIGAKENKRFAYQVTNPDIVGLTQNSDTPYGMYYGNTQDVGPVVMEMPVGTMMGVMDDFNFHYVTDLGKPGPDAGKGGKYLILPPDYTDVVPEGYIVLRPASYRFFCSIRVIPIGLTRIQAFDVLGSVKIYPFSETPESWPNEYTDVSDRKDIYATPAIWEGTFAYWETLKKAIDLEYPTKDFYNMYGLLAAVGIEKGKPFTPDEELKAILIEAAQKADEQMRVSAFASDNPARLAWDNRKWEWVVIGADTGYYEPNYLNLEVRSRWFYQATLETPKMFVRKEGVGSLYWLGIRDAIGEFIQGEHSYKLTIPEPIPAAMFWSITVYDMESRSEVQSEQFKPSISSLYDTLNPDADGNLELYFGPTAPVGKEDHWIQTVPGRSWFTYFRIYGPGKEAFDGSWRLGDLEKL